MVEDAIGQTVEIGDWVANCTAQSSSLYFNLSEIIDFPTHDKKGNQYMGWSRTQRGRVPVPAVQVRHVNGKITRLTSRNFIKIERAEGIRLRDEIISRG